MKKQLLNFFLILVMSYISTEAQWVQTNGPYGSLYNKVVTSGNSIFVGTSIGLYVSSDNGSNWEPLNFGETFDYGITSICSDKNTIVLVADYEKVYRSSNNGSTWLNINNELPDGTSFISITASDSSILLGSRKGIVYVSTNNGVDWAETKTGIKNESVNCVAINQGKLFAGSDYAYGLYCSTNNGLEWSVVGFQEKRIESITVINNKIYVGFIFGLNISTDNGASWTDLGFNYSPYSVAVKGNNIFAATYEGVYTSTNNGLTWQNNQSQMGDIITQTLAINGNYIFTGTYGKGIYASYDNGNSWFPSNNKIPAPIKVIKNQNGKFYTGSSGGNIFVSSNDGDDWSLIIDGYPSQGIFDIAFNGDDILVGSENWGAFRSTNGGVNWFRSSNGMSVVYVYKIEIYKDKIFAGTDHGLYVSSDKGVNWNSVNVGLPDPYTDVYSILIIGDNILIGTKELNGGSVYLSYDDGVSWSKILAAKGAVNSLVSCSNVQGENYIFAGTDRDGVYKTKNFISWSTANTGLPSAEYSFYLHSLTTSGNNIYLSATGSNYDVITQDWIKSSVLYFTSDQGMNWNKIKTDLSDNIVINTVTCNNNKIYLGTNYGILYRPISEITDVSKNESKVPTSFNLKQNYPNPFNPTTTIEYEISHSGQVRLNVFDILGRKVTELLNKEKPAGRYTVEFDGSNLTSGIYLYRIQTENYSEVRKMILTK